MGKRLILALGLLVLLLGWLLVQGSRSKGDAAAPTAGKGALQHATQPPALAADASNREGRTAAEEHGLAPSLAAVRVFVCDKDHKPIEGARVRTFEDSIPLERVTEADGRCALAIGRRDWFELEVTAAGFLGVGRRFSWTQELEVALPRYCTLIGRVLDARTKEPIAGASIAVGRDTRWLPQVGESISDALGRFRIEFAPISEDLDVIASADGYPRIHSSWNVLDQGDPIELELLLVAGVRLDVQVVEHPSGLPIAGAQLNEALTDDAGRATLECIPNLDGSIEISVLAEDLCTLTCTIDPDRIEASRLLLQLPRQARFGGIVRDEQGGPVQGAKLEFEQDYSAIETPVRQLLPAIPEGWAYWGETWGSAESDAEGHFVSPLLFPFLPLEVRAEHHEAGKAIAAHTLEGPGTTNWLDLRLTHPKREPAGTVEGYLLFNGEPLAGGVRWRKGTEFGGAKVDESGFYRYEVPAGVIELQVSFEDYHYAQAEQYLPVKATVTVENGGVTRQDFSFELPMASVGGRVIAEDGRPPSRLLVSVEELNGRFTQPTYTDSDGRWQDAVPDVGWEFAASLRCGGETFEVYGVHAGDLNVDFALPALGRLPVRVWDGTTGRPVSEWEATYRRHGEETFGALRRNHREAPRPDGAFVLELFAGEVDLLVHAPGLGYQTARVEGVLVSREVNDPLDVRLERGLDLEIELAPGLEPPPSDEFLIALFEVQTWDTVRCGPDVDPREASLSLGGSKGYSFESGPFYPGSTVLSRVLQFEEGRARLRGLAPGEWRFKSFSRLSPSDLIIEPEFVTLPHEGSLVIRWQSR